MKKILKKIRKPVDPLAPVTFPPGALDSARLHFYGHSLQQLAGLGGFAWGRIHADWGLTVCKQSGAKNHLPPLVLCSRDRLHSLQYIEAVIAGKTVDNIQLMLDTYDKEFYGMLERWKT